VTNDVDTLATALYATTDDMLKEHPDLAPWRPPVGITARLSDAELLTLATMQAILGYTSEAKWLRHARAHLRHLFPYLPQQPGYNNLAGWAEYGYCASHSRFFWGLRLHLVCTLGGLPVLFALTGAKADERETLRDMLDTAPDVEAAHPRQTIIGDKNYYGREFERDLTGRHPELLRSARKGEPERAGARLFKPLRQVIESINYPDRRRESAAWLQGALGELHATLTAQNVPASGPAGGVFADEVFTQHPHRAQWRTEIGWPIFRTRPATACEPAPET